MNNEEVWEKFLPKTRKGNFNSSLSQMSNSSCFSKDGRLSLSTKINARESWKLGRTYREPEVTPPRPSTSKKSSLLGTPRSSAKTRTPSSARTSSTRKSIASDGKTQKSLLSYFSSSSKKSDSFKVRLSEVVEITLDSDGEEENITEKIQDKSIERQSALSSGVSRVLFPSTSTAVTNDGGETSADIRTTRDSDKENRLSTPIAPLKHKEKGIDTVEDDSMIFPDASEKNLNNLVAGDSASGKTAVTFQTNHPMSVLTPTPVVGVRTADRVVGACKENIVSPPLSRANAADKATEKSGEALFIFKKKTSSKLPVTENITGERGNACTAGHITTIASPAAAIDNEIHSSAVGNHTAPPAQAVVNQLETLVKNTENQPKLQDNVDKGKKKMNTFELPKVPRHIIIQNGKVTNQIHVGTQQSAGNSSHDSAMRTESHFMPLADITHSPQRSPPLSKPSESQKNPTLNDPMENFTGVTECVSFQSSGDLWTPGELSRISSDEFDYTDGVKAIGPKKSHRKKENKTSGRNTESKIEKSKGKASKSPSVSKPQGKDRIKIPEKITNGKKIVPNVNGVSSLKSCPPKSTGENISPASERISFSPDDENLKGPIGQAFVIKSPSVEYLLNYGSLDDNSFVIEKDIACSDSKSEKSSVLADIKNIDADIANSSSSTLKVDIAVDDQSTNSGGRFKRGNFSASTVADSNKNNLNYQGSLRCVTLTESEWDRLPSLTNENQTFMMKGCSVGNTGESVASSTLNRMKKTGRKDNSFSSQPENRRVRPASQDLLTERAVSPQEAEEAPFNGMVVGSQPGVSDRKVMSPYSRGISSQSTEIRLSSAIEPMPPPELNRNVSPNKEDFVGRLASTQKVLDWMSKLKHNPGTSHRSLLAESTVSIDSESANKLGRDIGKANEVNRSGGHEINRVETEAHDCVIPSSDTDNNNVKSKLCQIECRVQVLVASYENPKRGLVIVDKECVVDKKCHGGIERFRKASAVLTTEVFEIPSTVNTQAKGGNSGNHHSDNPNESSIRVRRANLLQSHDGDSTPGHDIVMNVKAVYGKWGWEELDIECLDERLKDSVMLLPDKRLESCHLSFQRVCIHLCKCSRSLLVECIVLHHKVGIEHNSVGRSKFHTSLKNYESRWGVPDDPVTLSAVAYSKISSCFSNELVKNNSQLVNLSYEGGKHLPDSLSQVVQDMFEDSQEVMNEPICLDRAARRKKSPPVQSEISQLLKCAGDSLSDLGDTIATDSSDLEWMTQESEASKIYAVDQWKSLMKKMRDGVKSNESTSKSPWSRVPDPVSSSFTSLSTEGAYSEYGNGAEGYSQGRKPKICPFYKKIQGTRFAVDAFNFGLIKGITHYFLSHFHYDHYIGLNKSFSLPIYCSSVTAKLVVSKLRVNPNLIRRIDPGQTIKVDGVLITALDANHCPGSLMLLFQLPGGATHLHVGDFRAHIGMESFQAFWNAHVNDLYLDTTYCNPRYKFPSQERVIDNVLSIVESAVLKDPTTLIVCGSYTIGKERVFAAINEKFQFKIWAPPEKRRVLESVKEGLLELRRLYSDNPDVSEGGAARELNLIEALNMLTMVKEDAQVHVLPMSRINKKCLDDHIRSMRNFTNIIAFRPTGWAHGRMKANSESNLVFNSPSVKIYEVPYSEHSSFQELARFVKFIKPERVIKTVGSAGERAAMDVHINSWLKEARSKVPVPSRSCESPKSSQVVTQQRVDGHFIPKRKNNVMGMRLGTSQGNAFKAFGSGSMQTSFDSGSMRSSEIGYKQTEEMTSCQRQLHDSARKRVGSPIRREMTPKKRIK